MHRLLRSIIVAGLCAIAAGVPTLAQERTTTFVHGLGSSPATWDTAVSELVPPLALRPLVADLQWQTLYESQASELERELGGQVPADGIAVGHSNGGLVSRQWSRLRPLGGVITVGSPNQGAPIVDHIFDWLGHLDDVLNRIDLVNAIFVNDVDTVKWWWLPAQWKTAFAIASDIWSTAGSGMFSLGYDYRLPVMPQMRVVSSFMSNMNSGGNRDREAAEIPARGAIVNVARDFYDGGPFRIIAPGSYQDWHNAINIAGVALDVLASIVRINADPGEVSALDVSDALAGVAGWFLGFEDAWCKAVSDPSPSDVASCYEHDGIVPAWSQAYDHPRLPLIVNLDGPVHTEETRLLVPLMYQALTTIAHVPLRASLPPPPPEPTPPPPDPDPQSPPPPDPDPTPVPPPPSPDPVGRYKLNNGVCAWDPYDSGPNQCEPNGAPGRFKVDSSGACYFEPSEFPPDQCTPPPVPTGRFKLDGNGSCYWDQYDSGPHQCAP